MTGLDESRGLLNMHTHPRQNCAFPKLSVGAAFYAGDRPSSSARNRAPIPEGQDDTISRYQEPTSAPARVADIPRSSHAHPTISGSQRPRATRPKVSENTARPLFSPQNRCIYWVLAGFRLGLCCALGRIRTVDLPLRRRLLYPLSYEGGVLRHGSICAAGNDSMRQRRQPN